MKEINISGGGGWIAIAMLIVFTYGEPDLMDALIHRLMQ